MKGGLHLRWHNCAECKFTQPTTQNVDEILSNLWYNFYKVQMK